MEKENYNVIKCPYCDYEYLPGEIYLPEHLIGKPVDVERDFEGKILWADGLQPDVKETFVCNKCNKEFAVKANISFETSQSETIDFDSDYSSNKYEDRISLKED